ncbi:maestro heat-like repeat-containing protein family member 7 [Oryctolagus cuniculus]|uniref:maestro heat-like repeat-containing protein family member 7 n=1 Tax=Oryctolagus cuniculus TaxID=9986 RepID=UPI00387A7470
MQGREAPAHTCPCGTLQAAARCEISPQRVTFEPCTPHVSSEPDLTGLRQSERDAYESIMEFLEQERMSEFSKLSFLRAVETLSGVVRTQPDGNMNDYCPKNVLAKKVKMLILEESFEVLDSNVRQQAMLCIVALSQVNPPFHLSQKLDLVNAGVASVFSLPLIMPSLDRKDSASLYLQTVQALDDMLHALVMDDLNPDMRILQHFLEVLLPWVTLSDKVHEQTRALGAMSRLLRFICNFPELSHMAEFSMSGTLMGILGLFCLHDNHDISMGASEALHYLFKILVLQRSVKQKTEGTLKDLQKHFRGEWLASMQTLTWFFRKYLSPNERADVFLVAMETVASSHVPEVYAAARMLKMILKYPLPEMGKVPEIIQYIYHHMRSISEGSAQKMVRKILHLLAQAHTDDVILTLFKIEDQSQKGVRKPWEILASFPKGYEMIMEHLLQRLVPYRKAKGQEPGPRTVISPLIATRAIHELLLEPSRRMEVQSAFSSLFTALLSQISCLVLEDCADIMQDQQHVTEWVDPLSSTVEALKTLMRCSGYADHVSYVRKLGGWELLVNPERHYDGVAVLARSLVVMDCWHNCPLFSHIIRLLQEPDCVNHLTALVFLTELLQCPEVAATVDDITTHVLANWFKSEEPATLKVLLHTAEVFAQHPTTERRLRILQPHMLNCCYSSDGDIVMETLLVLRRLLQHLSWAASSAFLIQLSFTLAPFFEEELEHLRLAAFEIYRSLLAKVKRRTLVFPLRHQVLNLVIPLVLHLRDVNINVAQVCRLALNHTAALLGWSRLKVLVAEEDEFTILRALLQQQASKALWFLRQSVALFKSSQAAIRQAAVWFAGQIMQTLGMEEEEGVEEAYTALRSMRKDPDPTVSCLTMQTLYVLETHRQQALAKASVTCFCRRRARRSCL